MSDNRTIQLAEIPIGGEGGLSWNRLHEEREDICETLLNQSDSKSENQQTLLRARLRRIDDALDRLMSGANLDRDTHRQSDSNPLSAIILERLSSFDTILVHTHNSDYRILLLEPKTGRALVEGGSYLPEPSEGLLKGSALPGSPFNEGEICVDGRLEMWINEQVFLTSPVKSFEVKHNAAAESAEGIFAAMH